MPKKTKSDKILPTFFNAYRKRGFGLTVELIASTKNNEVLESEFFQMLKDNGSYLNEFYRSKRDLLNCGFLGYKLDESYEKVLYLTEKGIKFAEIISEIEKLIVAQ